MPNNLDVTIENLRVKVEANTTIGASAIAFIKGAPAVTAAAVAAAVEEALALGATPEQLAAFATIEGTLEAETQAFIDALSENVPTP